MLTTTSSTVLREESEESDISLELSQKQRDDSLDLPKKWANRKPLVNVANIDSCIKNLAIEEEMSKNLTYIAQGSTDEINNPPLLGSTK